jgi:hypothetical protein
MGGENPILKCKLFDAPGNNLPGRGIERPERGELLQAGGRSVSQERRRWRDRLSDDRNAQNLFKRLLGKCSN